MLTQYPVQCGAICPWYPATRIVLLCTLPFGHEGKHVGHYESVRRDREGPLLPREWPNEPRPADTLGGTPLNPPRP